MENLSDNQKTRITNVAYVVGSIYTLGSVGGLIYANKTGGKFWRYVGYFIVGGMVVGIPAKIISLPFINKIVKESKDNPISKQTTEVKKSLAETMQEELNIKNKSN